MRRAWSRSCVGMGVVALVATDAVAQDQPPPAPPPPPATQPPPVAGAEPPSAHSDDLALQLTNPVANLASIPFQFNWNSGVGPDDQLQLVLNIQPVVPVQLTEDWNLIGRFIVPLIGQPSLGMGSEPTFGMGDITFSLFLSPAAPSKLVWGVGPVFGLPGGSDPRINSGKWLLGPTGVALYLDAPWTAGVLVNQQWSVANTGDVDANTVSQLFVQPFVSYTRDRWTLTAMSEMTLDWEASSDAWSIPLELLGSRLTKIGFLPFSVQAGAGWFVESPATGPDWRLRLNFVVLLPNTATIKRAMAK